VLGLFKNQDEIKYKCREPLMSVSAFCMADVKFYTDEDANMI